MDPNTGLTGKLTGKRSCVMEEFEAESGDGETPALLFEPVVGFQFGMAEQDQETVDQREEEDQALQSVEAELPQLRERKAGAMGATFHVAVRFFNGLIASDKFCWSRFTTLRLQHWRRPLRLR